MSGQIGRVSVGLGLLGLVALACAAPAAQPTPASVAVAATMTGTPEPWKLTATAEAAGAAQAAVVAAERANVSTAATQTMLAADMATSVVLLATATAEARALQARATEAALDASAQATAQVLAVAAQGTAQAQAARVEGTAQALAAQIAQQAAPAIAPGVPPPPAAAGAAPGPTPPSASAVLARLKAAGLPIFDEVIFTAETDRNNLLGRPNQYIAKASWRDRRITVSGDPDVSTGGTVETFATEADRRTRQDYVAGVTRVPIFAEYAYAKGLVLVRVSGRLTPTQAAEYERAVAALP